MKLLTNAARVAPLDVLAARARKAPTNSLSGTPFGRAFLRYDSMDVDRDFSAAYAAYAIGNAGAKHTIVRQLYGDVAIRENAFNMDASEESFERQFMIEATALLSTARLRRKANSIVASIPVGRFDIGNYFFPDTRWSTQGAVPKNEQSIRQIVQSLRTSKFKALLTLDRALDVSISSEDVLAITPEQDYSERTVGRNEANYPSLFKQVFPRFRFLRASLNELATTAEKQRVIGASYGTNIPFSELSVEHPSFQASAAVASEALNVMLARPIYAYIECELDEEFIQTLTGQSVADVPLSLVGNWISGTLEFQWDPNESRVDDTIGDVTRVTSLSTARAESEASTTLAYDPAAANEHRLVVDNNGRFYFLPLTDNVEQYETELETTFTNDKGEWSVTDVQNPHNVLRFDDGTGRIRTMPRRVQANRVIFTDFKVGILNYTDANGVLKTYDVGFFRPVGNSHARQFLDLTLLRTNTDNEDFVGILNSAVRQAIQGFGQVPAPHGQGGNPLGLEDAVVRMMDDRFADFVEGTTSSNIIDLCNTLRMIYSGLPGQTQDMIDILRDLSFKHISPNSPIPELRVIYQLLEHYVQQLVDNFETAASNYRLIPTLERIGVLNLLVKYSPNYEEVFAADREERAPYTDEPEDYRDVVIPEIPFTRGVKLMPHQVKIFAKLKRFPKRFTLDVAAGGGKTFTAVLVCLMYMKHAGIKRPLVMCPNILLKNYFQDATYATSGAVNIIAINSDTLRRWGPERLAELINKAPANTVVVASFDSMAKGNVRVYGTRKIQQNAVTEFLKQFDFDMTVIDESHRIKRMSSNTNRNVARVTARAKVSGIMTGTLIYDTTKDVVGQFNLMDPSIFGSDSYFDEKFMEAEGGVRRAKSESPRLVKNRISENTAYVQVTRKEWAALLPPRIDEYDGTPTEKFHILNNPDFPDQPQMTQAQTDYYNLLLDKVRQEIMEDAETDKSLQRLLRSMEGRGGEEQEDEEEIGDELMTKLNPYLARLEIFVANPTNSREAEFTSRLASVEDRTSPKAKKVIEICRQHIERGYIGKILVFTQYNESAEGIFNALPPELRNLAVHYTAGNKTSLTQFESDPAKLILVGNERSIGTGLNLQMASRIIRCESTWNWGALEQAESRVNRPVPKSVETRKAIYLDWIVVNRTIDVTKISRMISKAVESYKFVNAGNPSFDDMPALEAVKLSLENILLRNDIDDPNHDVATHFTALELCRQLEEEEFQNFRNDPNVRDTPYELNGGILPNSGLLKNVPYVPGISLYGRDELGLIPFIEYVTQERHSTLVQFNPTDLVIHTEDGDGICTGFRRNVHGELSSVTVELPDGSKSVYDLASVFVVTKPNVDVDTRRQIAEVVMSEHLGRPVNIAPENPLNVAPVEPEPGSPADPNRGKPNKGKIKLLRNKPVPNADKEANAEYKLYCMSIGHAYTIAADTEDPDVPVDVLVDNGFMQVRPFYYAEFKNPRQLQEWYEKARRVTGFASESRQQIEDIIELMFANRRNTFFQNVTPDVLRDFWRSQKSAPKAGFISPYVSIEDNATGKFPKIYVVAMKHLNPQFRNVTTKARVAGVEWDITTHDQYWYMAKSQKDALRVVDKINNAAPIKNYNLLIKNLRQLRPTPAR